MPRDTVLQSLYEIAEGQDGYFTTVQAADQGVDHQAINKAAYRGRVRRLSQGVYRFVRFPMLSERTHLWEAVLWPQARGNIRTVLSHETALTLHGLSDVNPAQVHISVPRAFRLRRDTPPWLVVHRENVTDDDIDYIVGLPVTGVQRTLRDIARTASPAVLHDALRDAQRKGLTIPAELKERRV